MKYLILLLSVCGWAYSADVCVHPFSRYLKCSVRGLEQDINTIIKEATPKHKSQIKYCFQKNSCPQPDFNIDDVTGLFLTGKWKARVDSLLDFLEKLPKGATFRVCMARRFKDYARELVDKCVEKYGPNIESYETPPIPGFENIKVEDVKALFDVRMLTRDSLLKCYNCDNSKLNSVQSTYRCLEQRRNFRDDTLCEDRDRCIARTLSDNVPCLNRHYAVQKAVCKCGKEEIKIGGLGLLSRSPKLKRAVLAFFKKDFQECYQAAGKRFPYTEFRRMRHELRTAILDLGINFREGSIDLNIPDELKYAFSLAKSLLSELVTKLTDLVCADCESHQAAKRLPVRKIAKEAGICGPKRAQPKEESPEDTGGEWDDWD